VRTSLSLRTSAMRTSQAMRTPLHQMPTPLNIATPTRQLAWHIFNTVLNIRTERSPIISFRGKLGVLIQ